MVPPAAWKKSMQVGSDKKQVCARASELFPDNTDLFYGSKGGPKDGVAEAALLALYGRKQFFDTLPPL